MKVKLCLAAVRIDVGRSGTPVAAHVQNRKLFYTLNRDETFQKALPRRFTPRQTCRVSVQRVLHFTVRVHKANTESAGLHRNLLKQSPFKLNSGARPEQAQL